MSPECYKYELRVRSCRPSKVQPFIDLRPRGWGERMVYEQSFVRRTLAPISIMEPMVSVSTVPQSACLVIVIFQCDTKILEPRFLSSLMQ
jgi:hypothetical protein